MKTITLILAVIGILLAVFFWPTPVTQMHYIEMPVISMTNTAFNKPLTTELTPTPQPSVQATRISPNLDADVDTELKTLNPNALPKAESLKTLANEQLELTQQFIMRGGLEQAYTKLFDEPNLALILGDRANTKLMTSGYAPNVGAALRQDILAVYGDQIRNLAIVCNARYCTGLADLIDYENFTFKQFCYAQAQQWQFDDCFEANIAISPYVENTQSTANFGACSDFVIQNSGVEEFDIQLDENTSLATYCNNLKNLKGQTLSDEVDRLLACQQAHQPLQCLANLSLTEEQEIASYIPDITIDKLRIQVKLAQRQNENLQLLPMHTERLLTGDALQSRLTDFITVALDNYNQEQHTLAQLAAFECAGIYCQVQITGSRKLKFHRGFINEITSELTLSPWCRKQNEKAAFNASYPLEETASIWQDQQFECVFVQGQY